MQQHSMEILQCISSSSELDSLSVGNAPPQSLRLGASEELCIISCPLPSIISIYIILGPDIGSGHRLRAYPATRGPGGRITTCRRQQAWGRLAGRDLGELILSPLPAGHEVRVGTIIPPCFTIHPWSPRQAVTAPVPSVTSTAKHTHSSPTDPLVGQISRYQERLAGPFCQHYRIPPSCCFLLPSVGSPFPL